MDSSPTGIASQLGTRLVFSKGRMIPPCCDLLQQENSSSTQWRTAGTCFLDSATLKLRYSIIVYVRKPKNATEKERVIPILLLIQTLFSTMFMTKEKLETFLQDNIFCTRLKKYYNWFEPHQMNLVFTVHVLTLIENMDAFSLI